MATKLVQSAPVEGENGKLDHDQLFALTRDNFGREDPDKLLWGFIPVWAIVIFTMAALMAVIAVLGFLGHLCGCRNKNKTSGHLKLENY